MLKKEESIAFLKTEQSLPAFFLSAHRKTIEEWKIQAMDCIKKKLLQVSLNAVRNIQVRAEKTMTRPNTRDKKFCKSIRKKELWLKKQLRFCLIYARLRLRIFFTETAS